MNELYINGIPNVRQGSLWSPLGNYAPRSILDIVGKKCGLSLNPNSLQDWISASKLISIYNDPRFETARYLIIKENKITAHIAVSNEIPNSTNVYPHTWMLNRLRLQLEKDNSYLLFQHNHPSGFPYPSDNDINVTRFLNGYFIDNHERHRFLGHIITGNGCSSFYDGITHSWKGIQDDRVCSLNELKIRPPYSNLLNMQGSLALLRLNEYAKQICKEQIDTDNCSLGFYANAAGYITGISTLDNRDFWNNQQRIIETMNENSKKSGASTLYVVIPKKNPRLFEQVEDFCGRTKKIANVLMPSDGKIIQLAENRRSNSVFHSGESVPLKISDSRELRPQIKKYQQQKRNNQLDYEIDR